MVRGAVGGQIGIEYKRTWLVEDDSELGIVIMTFPLSLLRD